MNEFLDHYELNFLKVGILGNAVDQGWTDFIFVQPKDKVILFNQLNSDNELARSDCLLKCFSY